MTSMLCRKESGGQVYVHDNGLVEGLAVDSNDKIMTMMMSREGSSRRRRMPRPNTTPSPSRSVSRNMDTNSLIGKTMEVQHWLNEKTIKTLQEKSDLESKAARQLYSPLLQTENTFVKDVEDFITHRETTNLRKKEVLHKNWSERVYKPLRKKIIEAMDSNDWPEVDRRKRELHKQYLEFTNQKGHVFLDTMDPEEYYAMALNGHRPAPIKDEKPDGVHKSVTCQKQRERELKKELEMTKRFIARTVCIETRPLHDPLISQGRQRNEEDRTILRCLTGYRYSDKDIEQVKMPAMPLVPLGRHGTDSIRWLKMPLSNIESTPRLASRKRMFGKFNDTEIDFEVWTKTPYNHAAVDKELQIQKKRQYPEDQRPPFPKPVMERVSLKPVRSVTFQEPVVNELALQPVTEALQQTSIGLGTN